MRTRLGEITDPDLGITLERLGAVAGIDYSDKKINVKLKLVGPTINAAEKIIAAAEQAAREFDPEPSCEFSVEELIPARAAGTALPNVKHIIAVSSGKGGVGKSAIAANLAAGLAMKGAKVGILDSDVYGPSQPTMFGLENSSLAAVEMPDGRTVAIPCMQHGVKVASMGFVMNRNEAAIMRGPMLASYFSMLFEQVEWGDLDFLVFDLPPGTGDIQLTMTQKIPLTGAVVVTTPQEIALADVRRALTMFGKVNVRVLGIIENMSYFEPEDAPGKKYYIFGKGGGRRIAEESGVNLLGEVPLDIEMREGNDSGMPVVLDQSGNKQAGVLREVIDSVLSEVRRANYSSLNGTTVEISL